MVGAFFYLKPILHSEETSYFKTNPLLGTYRLTNSENAKASETKNENRMTKQKRNEAIKEKLVTTMLKHKLLLQIQKSTPVLGSATATAARKKKHNLQLNPGQPQPKLQY